MEKSPDAFRTISEVAEWLDVPTHVLRFWESRFAQIKPVKRAGGRRYYRPSDMRLIGGVKTLLHDQGLTIRGVQKMLREHGVKHISSFSQALDIDLDDGDVDGNDDRVIDHAPAVTDTASPAPAARQTYAAEPAPEPRAAPDENAPEVEHDGALPDMFETAANTTDDATVEPITDEDASNEAPVAMPTFVPSRSRSVTSPAEPVAETAPEPTAPPQKAIPDTPGVPASDPNDDDPHFSGAPSRAARLAVLPMAKLAAHRDTLRIARDRLKALRAAQS